MTRGNDVAQSTGSTEPRCGWPATSPWPAGHVLPHFQKSFCLRFQQRWCSRYPMPKSGARRKLGRPSNAQKRCKEETWSPDQVAWPTGLTSGPHVPNLRPEHRLTPPINIMVLSPAEGVKKVRFSPSPPRPQGASKFSLCRVEREARF
jgi:hypothetical protein